MRVGMQDASVPAMLPIVALLLSLAPSFHQDPTPARGERWILRCADGRTLRVLARETPDGFEIRPERAWEKLPNGSVLRAERERDVLKGLSERRTAAGSDLAARVDVARYALDEGLLAEAIGELDAVLGLDPDYSPAREVLADAPLALTLPATAGRTLATRLVLFGARAKPAYRELAASRLATAPRDESLPELARNLLSPSASVRAFAAFALRRIDPAASQDMLVRRSVIDPDERTRLESARALRDARDETLARRVEAALLLEDARLRTQAAGTLAEMGYRSSTPALVASLAALPALAGGGSHPGGTRAHIRVGTQVAYVQDFNPEIAQGASIADPVVNVVEDATELDVRVGGTSTQRVTVEGPTICRALARLTGEKVPEKPSAWLAWWKENEARYRAGLETRDGNGSSGSGSPTGTGRTGKTGRSGEAEPAGG
jgi:hypothetical protein